MRAGECLFMGEKRSCSRSSGADGRLPSGLDTLALADRRCAAGASELSDLMIEGLRVALGFPMRNALRLKATFRIKDFLRKEIAQLL
jgi:hypothetical protein